jgi:hypothetical protein
MNDEQKRQMEEIIRGLHDFTLSEHPRHTRQVTIKGLKCLQLGPDVFAKIRCCNDFIARGIKFEIYSTSCELPDFRGVAGRGFYRANSGRCTMHSDGRKHEGLIFRCRMFEEDDQNPLVRECREFILYILRTFCPSYRGGPYQSSAERVQIMNLLN